MRGRKIRIDVPQSQPEQPELDLEVTEGAAAENGDVESPSGADKQQQVIIVDGEPLNYEASITWECFPGNIEILIDDSIFVQNETFSRKLTP